MADTSRDEVAAGIGRWRKPLARGLVPFALFGYVLGMWWLDRWSIGVAFDAYLDGPRLLANAAVGLMLFLLLAALSRRLLAPALLVAGLHALVYAVSSIKYGLLGEVLVLQDVQFVSGFDASSLALLWRYVPSPLLVSGLLAAGVIGIALVHRIEPPWCRARAWSRFAVAGVAAALLVALHASAWPWTLGAFDKAQVRPSPFGPNLAALHAGLGTSLVHHYNRQRQVATRVDTQALRRTIALLATRGGGTTTRHAAGATHPDIVIVLSESFMDPRVMRGMDDVPDLIPNVRAQLAAGHGGRLRVPAFGGGTVRTEFEVLTGMPARAFPELRYPYVELSLGFIPGIVDTLERAGYASVAVHGNAGSVWNRDGTYKAMGVDRFITKPDFVRRGVVADGKWLSDRGMTDILLQELDRAGKPTLAIGIGMENHGPYDDAGAVGDPAAMAAIALPAGLDDKGARELRRYLYHLRNADREFGRLLAGLRTRGRPFVLLFFGDHLPALGDVYARLGLVDGQRPSRQTVPWVLVGGSATAAASNATFDSWQLPSMVLDAAGVQGDAYFDFAGRVGGALAEPGATSRQAVLRAGLYAGANARLRNRFDDHARE